MYYYELHCHTKESSRCAKIPAAELVDFYVSIGFSGAVITDHFVNGNCTVGKNLPWEERIDGFFAGYRAAKARGDAVGFSVFAGVESSYFGTDVLFYGPSPAWYREHAGLDGVLNEPNALFDAMHAAGAFLVHAHPFREADYIAMLRLFPRKVDGVEVFNAQRTPHENHMAQIYAKEYGLLPSVGSDNHVGACDRLVAVALEEKAETLDDLLLALRTGRAEFYLFSKMPDGSYRKSPLRTADL